MNSYKKDYEFGKKKEDELFDIINKHFNDNLVRSTKRYDKYDFKGDKFYYELKSRNNNYNKYPTTLIDKDKIFSDNHIFLFNYLDGLYYIKYDKEEFDKFECKDFVRFKRYGCKDIEKPYFYIPINKLTKIDF